MPSLVAALLTFVLVGVPQTAAAPPAGDISSNVEYVTNLPEPATAISINFIGETMFVSAVNGIYSYDVSNPAAPELLGALPLFIYQNEDVTVDPVRKLLFISRDPRGFTGQATPEQARFIGQVEIINVADARVMVPVGAFQLPAGHTTTCISDDGVNPCDFVWTGGPYANTVNGTFERGRPIYATDVSDPQMPEPCPEPLNMGLRHDGGTGYAHDVEVDAEGIAWVSSDGGIHGYWTYGEHLDPRTGEVRTATPCDPVPYAGGVTPTTATPSRFMHNSHRDLDAQIPGDPASRGHILYATEEAFGGCATTGRFATYDLRTSLGGAGFTDPTTFELTALDSWTPEGAEGATGCASAHYFEDRGDGILAYGFYGQGTRFLDVRDPTNVVQIGYYRPDGNNTWAAYWYGDNYVFVADNGRGVDVLRFHDAAAPVVAPPLPAGAALTPARMDPGTGYLCPLP